jgi:hypothetical protein
VLSYFLSFQYFFFLNLYVFLCVIWYRRWRIWRMEPMMYALRWQSLAIMNSQSHCEANTSMAALSACEVLCSFSVDIIMDK